MILIILAHPNLGSFNHAIAEAVVRALKKSNQKVILHDLYAEQFDAIFSKDELRKDAVLDPVIQKHCDELVHAEGIVIVHPNWWGQPPAILKGWVDRVVRQGSAYKFGVNDKGEGVPIGLLKAKAALVFNTSNTPEAREQEIFGDPLETLWKKCVFEFCGVPKVIRKNYSVVVTSSPEERASWLSHVESTVVSLF